MEMTSGVPIMPYGVNSWVCYFINLSWKTLHGREKMETFQDLFDSITIKLVETDAVDSLSSKFKLLWTDEERMRLILETDVIGQSIREWAFSGPSQQKSSVASESLRLQGNTLFKKRNFTAALRKYTESVFNADCSTESSSCLSFALANRSAVLFQTNSYQDALKDAELAISCGYPDELMYKVLDRIGKCYLKLNRFAMGKKCFRDAFLALSKSQLSVDSKNELAFEYCKLERECANRINEGEMDEKVDNECDPEKEKMDCNSVYPCATSAFSIVSNAELGRHAIATKNISAGDVILFEKAYASVLFKENRLTHCYHCLRRCKTLIGCVSCNIVGFCSVLCRGAAIEKYHSTECQFISILHATVAGFGHLALRMIITAGFSYLASFDRKKASSGLTDYGKYESQSYTSVHSLIGHSEKRSLSDLFCKSVLAAFLLHLLEQDDFFTLETDKQVLLEKKVCIGSHILKQLQMLPCNAHEVSELQVDTSSIADSKLKEIGSAIYATLSLLNHSCDPTVVRYSYGSSCVLRAIKQIKRGEMIIDNYGALYAVQNLNERQNLASLQYFFNCACVPCKNGWPLYNYLPNKAPKFKCSKCEQPIKTCSTFNKLHCKICCMDLSVSTTEFSASRGQFANAMNAVLDGGSPKKHLPCLLDHLQLICDVVQLPWQEFNNCQEIVKQCYGMLGNHHYF